jgi:2,3-bisphosphoglycerate-independent phosphoglycerate mutase
VKYVFLVPDGMADLPLDDLDGQTPLQAARTPNFDKLASDGLVGAVMTVPVGMYPGSDAANMSLLGYDPAKYYTGRGPIEAVAMQVPLDAHDVAFRCSLVTSDGDTMIDYSSGHITTDEARVLIELVDKKLGTRELNFYPGVSYRHIMAWRNGSPDVKTTPPHEITGATLAPYWPEGDNAERLQQLMYDSFELLDNHEINRRRRDEGKNPGNMLWLWSAGYAPNMPSFLTTHGRGGAVITAVDVVRGLARATGLEVVDVPGATGYFDTDYEAKARYALSVLDRLDFVYVHVEAPDEAGHAGSIEEKIRAIEEIDKKVLGTLLAGLPKQGDYRILIAPDHMTPISLRGHEEGPVPFLLYDSTTPNRQSHYAFDERAVQEATTQVDDGTRLIRMLFAV